eukprot:2672268-Prorocentrum_lima.AAC.1
MTSSLVGSEMCIRDSPYPLQEVQMEVAPDPSVALQQHLQFCHEALNSACLLYTSPSPRDSTSS